MQFLFNSLQRKREAFTLTEVMVAVGLIGILFISLYMSFSMGFALIRSARENAHATQLLVQRAEGLRLYSWNQLLDPTYFKTNFTDSSPSALGTVYYGTIQLSIPANIGSPNYRTNMRAVTISVRWTNAVGTPLPHYREMHTQVAKYGVQNYEFGN